MNAALTVGGRPSGQYRCDALVIATPVGSDIVDSTRHPSLVHARLTPFGEDGPWSGFARGR